METKAFMMKLTADERAMFKRLAEVCKARNLTRQTTREGANESSAVVYAVAETLKRLEQES